MSVTLRPARESDLAAYTGFAQRMFETVYVNPDIGLTKERFAMEIFTNESTQKYLASNLVTNEKQQCWLAVEDSNIIGAITVANTDDACEIKGFYVSLEYQDKGIGKQLWNKALEFAVRKDVVLDTYVHNTRTVDMYRKWGLELDTTRGEGGYFYRHWDEWPEGLRAKCLYMRLKRRAS